METVFLTATLISMFVVFGVDATRKRCKFLSNREESAKRSLRLQR